MSRLVDLDRTINTSDKRIGGQKSNSSCQEAVNSTGKEAIAEEEQAGHKSGDVELEQVVPDTVGKDPKCAAATSEETLPPPMIVLEGQHQFLQKLKDVLPRSRADCMLR